jgi:hypothetical protein
VPSESIYLSLPHLISSLRGDMQKIWMLRNVLLILKWRHNHRLAVKYTIGKSLRKAIKQNSRSLTERYLKIINVYFHNVNTKESFDLYTFQRRYVCYRYWSEPMQHKFSTHTHLRSTRGIVSNVHQDTRSLPHQSPILSCIGEWETCKCKETIYLYQCATHLTFEPKISRDHFGSMGSLCVRYGDYKWKE